MRTYHHGNLREALVATGVELGRAGGPDAIVLRELARRIGVSRTAAYQHFTDREDLLREIARVSLAELSDAMLRGIARVRSSAPEERARLRLRATGKAYVAFALAEPGLFAVAFNAVTFDDLTGPFQHLVQALDECVKTGFIHADKRRGAEMTCWAYVHGFAMLYGTGPLRETPARARDGDLERLLDRIEESLRA